MSSWRSQRRIGDVVSLAHELPDPLDFDQELLAMLDRAVGFDIAFIGVQDPVRPLLTLTGLTSERERAGLADTRFIALLRHRRAVYDVELAPVARAAERGRGVAVDSAVLPTATLRESAYHRELREPVGGRHSLLAYARVHRRQPLIVMLGRTGSTFRSQSVALVEELLPAITLAHASFASRDVAPVVVPAGQPALSVGSRRLLTPRERDVLEYLCLGYTNREIALACGSSPNTVRNQLVSIFAKLGVTTRSEAVGVALGATGS